MLEDRVDVAAERRHPGDRLALEQDLAGRRLLEPGDHPEGRRLAAARRPEEAVELAPGDPQGHLVDRDDVAEALGHLEDLDVRRRDRPPTPPSRSVGSSGRDRGAGCGDRWVAGGHGCGQRRPRGWDAERLGTLHPPRTGQRMVRAAGASVKGRCARRAPRPWAPPSGCRRRPVRVDPAVPRMAGDVCRDHGRRRRHPPLAAVLARAPQAVPRAVPGRDALPEDRPPACSGLSSTSTSRMSRSWPPVATQRSPASSARASSVARGARRPEHGRRGRAGDARHRSRPRTRSWSCCRPTT